jgi:O-antigen/teichoic acid export membrane protein
VRRLLEEASYVGAVLDKVAYIPLIAFGPELVRILFSERWLPSAPVMEAAAWGAAAVSSFCGAAFAVLNGLGRANVLAVSNAIMLMLTWLLLFPFVRWFGLVGYGYVLSLLWLVTPYVYFRVRQEIGPFHVFRATLVPLIAFVSAVLAIRALAARAVHEPLGLLGLIGLSAVGAGFYLAILAVFDRRRLWQTLQRIGRGTQLPVAS